MNTELMPSLHKLERQCEQYHEWAVSSQRHEALRRQCVAHDYMTTLKCAPLPLRRHSPRAHAWPCACSSHHCCGTSTHTT